MSGKKRPKCPKCSTGFLIPEYEPFVFSNDGVKCLLCGERRFKSYVLHAPTQHDKRQGALNIWE